MSRKIHQCKSCKGTLFGLQNPAPVQGMRKKDKKYLPAIIITCIECGSQEPPIELTVTDSGVVNTGIKREKPFLQDDLPIQGRPYWQTKVLKWRDKFNEKRRAECQRQNN